MREYTMYHSNEHSNMTAVFRVCFDVLPRISIGLEAQVRLDE
jgi:hypothetical protein